MYLPSLTTTKQSRDSIAQFNGLCRTNECADSEMRLMHNMSLKDFPYLSTRRVRKTLSTSLTNVKGILGGENLYIVSTNKLTIISKNGEITTKTASFSDTDKTLVRMGNYLCIFPDKKVYDGTNILPMEVTNATSSVTFTLTDANGNAITYHDAAYYETHEPQDGDYLLTEVNGVNELQRYAITSGTWYVVTTAYVMASATGIGANLNEFDGVKISLDLNGETWTKVTEVLPLEEDGVYYATYPLKSVSDDAITFSGLITDTKELTGVTFTVARETPDIAYVTEANNRLWGCNAAGTEIYATKLGSPFNWNCFEGISTDSWAVTVGSDGEFTGAITYLGYPTFFKENSLIKIAIAGNGAHQTKETICRGVQKGCSESLCVVNEILYYKSQIAICAYDGSLPQTISKKLGDMSGYTHAIGGRNKECYYILCQDGTDVDTFVYDTQKGAWAEDDDKEYKSFTTWNNILVGAFSNEIDLFDEMNVSGTYETAPIIWSCETNNIDYQLPEAKYIHRLVIKTTMGAKSRARAWVRYDDGMYERLFEMRSVGTKVYPLSIIPRRCDHFSIRLEGEGNVTIHSITKFIETGSDLY